MTLQAPAKAAGRLAEMAAEADPLATFLAMPWDKWRRVECMMKWMMFKLNEKKPDEK